MIPLENARVVASNDCSVQVGIFHVADRVLVADRVILRQLAVSSMLQSMRMVKEKTRSATWSAAYSGTAIPGCVPPGCVALDALKYPSRAHAAADAHGDHAVPRAFALQIADQSSREFRPGAAQRMAQCDRATVRIHA
jgi:hypothetical protein